MNKPNVSAVAFLALLGACATPEVGTVSNLPENLKVPADEMLSVATTATGVQIYECAARKDQPTRFEWTFKAPEAELFGTNGRRIGRHYAGPTWESNDGSKVVGMVKARDNAPDPDAIPWLLLGAKSVEGEGIFARTTSIQRVSTVGGIVPKDACSEAQAGKLARVAYSATYYFYVPRP